MTKPWRTSSWKRKRKEVLEGKVCEWCGSGDSLAIHHLKHFRGRREFRRVLSTYLKSYFSGGRNRREKQELLGKARRSVGSTNSYFCPSCGHVVYARKTMLPRYRCWTCKATTDTPIKKSSPSKKRAVTRKFRALFFKRYEKEIRAQFAQEREAADKEYLAFDKIIILCKRCHYATEKGLVLCEICGQSYHRPKYGKCWGCFKKTRSRPELSTPAYARA